MGLGHLFQFSFYMTNTFHLGLTFIITHGKTIDEHEFHYLLRKIRESADGVDQYDKFGLNDGSLVINYGLYLVGCLCFTFGWCSHWIILNVSDWIETKGSWIRASSIAYCDQWAIRIFIFRSNRKSTIKRSSNTTKFKYILINKFEQPDGNNYTRIKRIE